MKNVRDFLRIYLVMGSVNCKEDPCIILEEAIKGGVTMFQFREKGNGSLQGFEKKSLAQKLQLICQRYDVPFIVNDDIALAIEIDADGVHIGQEDEPIKLVREKIGSKILGVSAHDYEEAKAAVNFGADYLGVGPMFPTRTKTDIREVKGPKVIQEIRKSGIDIPLVGIGGITPINNKEVIEAGADGVAVITAISQSSLPQEAARSLKIDKSLKTYN